MMESTDHSEGGRKGLVAACGVISAILASTCCIAPLVLLSLGISGAWMGNLTALAPYQNYFIAATLLFIGAGYWFVYWRPKKVCEKGSYCASPGADRVIKFALWFSTVLVALALGVNLLLPYLL